MAARGQDVWAHKSRRVRARGLQRCRPGPRICFSVLPASCRQNGTMRHATVCRQDAGSTFGVTFRPPLNTYQSRAPTALSGSWSQCMRNKREEATHEHPSTGGA